MVASSEAARFLGAPLEEGEGLYTQHNYMLGVESIECISVSQS